MDKLSISLRRIPQWRICNNKENISKKSKKIFLNNKFEEMGVVISSVVAGGPAVLEELVFVFILFFIGGYKHLFWEGLDKWLINPTDSLIF